VVDLDVGARRGRKPSSPGWLYHYGSEKLINGKYCALGTGVRLMTNGATAVWPARRSSPPPPWVARDRNFDLLTGLSGRGDTGVGNDVWFGHGTTVLPGVQIGRGAIMGSGVMVRRGARRCGCVEDRVDDPPHVVHPAAVSAPVRLARQAVKPARSEVGGPRKHHCAANGEHGRSAEAV
jgi:acetyltransferase-like isoleucine patch superfamily enzyme